MNIAIILSAVSAVLSLTTLSFLIIYKRKAQRLGELLEEHINYVESGLQLSNASGVCIIATLSAYIETLKEKAIKDEEYEKAEWLEKIKMSINATIEAYNQW